MTINMKNDTIIQRAHALTSSNFASLSRDITIQRAYARKRPRPQEAKTSIIQINPNDTENGVRPKRKFNNKYVINTIISKSKQMANHFIWGFKLRYTS